MCNSSDMTGPKHPLCMSCMSWLFFSFWSQVSGCQNVVGGLDGKCHNPTWLQVAGEQCKANLMMHLTVNMDVN